MLGFKNRGVYIDDCLQDIYAVDENTYTFNGFIIRRKGDKLRVKKIVKKVNSYDINLDYFINRIKDIKTLDIRETGLNICDISLFNIKELNCSGNGITHLDTTFMKNIERLVCTNNFIESIDTSNLENLKHLHCNINYIEDIDLNNMTNLITAEMNGNKLTLLKVELPTLRELDCYNNNIDVIHLRNMTNIKSLYIDRKTLLFMDKDYKPTIYYN